MHYIPTTSIEEKELLSACGANNFSDLIKIIPSKFKLNRNLGIGPPLSELDVERELQNLSDKNISKSICFMGGGVYDTNNMQELVAHNLGIKPGVDNQVAREIGAVQTMKEAGVDPKQMPAVADAMTRDYSGLMKAMDKKKENK